MAMAVLEGRSSGLNMLNGRLRPLARMVHLLWPMRLRITILRVTMLMLAAGCGADADPSVLSSGPDHAHWMLEHTDAYLHDTSWRRAELEASLWRPELPYARKRLAAYSLDEGGWDLLPTIDGRVEPVSARTASSDGFDGRQLVPDQTPRTYEQWLALGEDVFWSMPMRRDAYLEWVASKPELWDEVGLQTRGDGALRGVVRFRDARGELRMAATCGLCHGHEGKAGRASRQLDLGKGRALFAIARGADPSDYAQWGKGAVDVTDDGVTDALAIPDLWGVSHQTYVNSSGAVRIASPASLAVRFETQYIVGHSMEARPNRVLTWALAMYVMSLEAPASADNEPNNSPAGRDVFDKNCATCHRPEQGYSGGLVAADTLPSNPQAASSAFRGTGYYKVPSLLDVGQGAPYLHDASKPSLRALLDSGHPGHVELSEPDKTHLIEFLKTL